LKRVLLIIAGLFVVLAAGVYAAFQLSPWPSVWLIRNSFDQGAAQAAASVAPHVPEGISAQRAISYAPGDEDALLDVFVPSASRGPLPAVIWVHGGGFIAGTRSDLAGYMQVLASRGFVTVAIDYTPGPEARFPTPIRQTNAALNYIVANARRYNIDPKRIFLAGDSAGAQIAAQTALTISDRAYAQRIGIAPGMPRESLRGLVLYCGPYDPTKISFEGPFGSFLRTAIWSYVGTRDPRDPRVAQLAVLPHVTPAFPPTFISVGNADPLAPQSVRLVNALRAKGVEVDALFFAPDHKPPLGHEYQLLLSTEAGRQSLERSVRFLTREAGKAGKV
jgi:acetyl esterase/lipase